MSILEQIQTVSDKLNSGMVVSIDVDSCEEVNVIEMLLKYVLPDMEIPVYTFDIALGFVEVGLGESGIFTKPAEIGYDGGKDFIDALSFLRDFNKPGFFILIDLHKEIDHPIIQRLLKAVADAAFNRNDLCFCLMGQGVNLPQDFSGRVVNVEIPLPTAAEIENEIRTWIPVFQEEIEDIDVAAEGSKAWVKMVRSWQGLTLREGSTILREVAIGYEEIGNATAERLHIYKVSKLKKLGVELAEPPKETIGGLEGIKQWLGKRVHLLTDTEDPLKGILCVGCPGTGKSLLAKNVGQQLNLPTFRLDMSAIYGSLVGESEKNTKRILTTIAAAAPGVMWIDEAEKAFSQSGGDDGTSKRVFGMFLTWMQENSTPIFTIMTANDISSLPPEFLRKGRFDEIFFVDLPDQEEREQILKIHISKYHKGVEVGEWASAIAAQTPDFSGAELAAIVKAASIEARSQNLPGLRLEDLETEASITNPLARQQADKIARLRSSGSQFRKASLPKTVTPQQAEVTNLGRTAGKRKREV